MYLEKVGNSIRQRRLAWARRRDDESFEADLVEQMILRAFNLRLRTLKAPARGMARTAFARQVAIYVLHVRLGHSLTGAARQFGRDRTTAAHACRLVEDRREDHRFDAVVASIEEGLEHWIHAGPAARRGREVRA